MPSAAATAQPDLSAARFPSETDPRAKSLYPDFPAKLRPRTGHARGHFLMEHLNEIHATSRSSGRPRMPFIPSAGYP